MRTKGVLAGFSKALLVDECPTLQMNTQSKAWNENYGKFVAGETVGRFAEGFNEGGFGRGLSLRGRDNTE